MKTDYTEEIQDLLQSNFKPVAPDSEGAIAMSLTEIHEQITNVLPAKWVDESDVYAVLLSLGYKLGQCQEVDDKVVLKYFLIPIQIT